jgi:hypothetical protein
VLRWSLSFLSRVFADHSPVQFDLTLAWSTAQPDAASLALKVAPAPHQAIAEVLQLREFNLQFAFVALSAGGENLQDQPGSVEHLDAQPLLEVALLCRRQGLVENHALPTGLLYQKLDLVGFARANEQRRIGRLATSRQACHRLVACRLRQKRQLVERRIEAGRAHTEVDTNQNRLGLRDHGGRIHPRLGLRGRKKRKRRPARARAISLSCPTPWCRSRPGSSRRGLARRSRSRACRPSV